MSWRWFVVIVYTALMQVCYVRANIYDVPIGGRITVPCVSGEVFKKSDVKWDFGHRSKKVTKNYVIDKGGDLLIRKVTSSDAGTLKCLPHRQPTSEHSVTVWSQPHLRFRLRVRYVILHDLTCADLRGDVIKKLANAVSQALCQKEGIVKKKCLFMVNPGHCRLTDDFAESINSEVLVHVDLLFPEVGVTDHPACDAKCMYYKRLAETQEAFNRRWPDVNISKVKALRLLTPVADIKPELSPAPLLNMDHVRSSCDDGWTLEGEERCRPCHPGTRFARNRCKPCPIGEYQEEFGATKCNPCPYGFTMLPGADSVKKCSSGRNDVRSKRFARRKSNTSKQNQRSTSHQSEEYIRNKRRAKSHKGSAVKNKKRDASKKGRSMGFVMYRRDNGHMHGDVVGHMVGEDVMVGDYAKEEVAKRQAVFYDQAHPQAKETLITVLKEDKSLRDKDIQRLKKATGMKGSDDLEPVSPSPAPAPSTSNAGNVKPSKILANVKHSTVTTANVTSSEPTSTTPYPATDYPDSKIVCHKEEKLLGRCVFGPDDESQPACQFTENQQVEGKKAEKWNVTQGKDVLPFPQSDHTLTNISGFMLSTPKSKLDVGKYVFRVYSPALHLLGKGPYVTKFWFKLTGYQNGSLSVYGVDQDWLVLKPHFTSKDGDKRLGLWQMGELELPHSTSRVLFQANFAYSRNRKNGPVFLDDIIFATCKQEHKKSKKFSYTEDEDEEDIRNVTHAKNVTYVDKPSFFSGSRVTVFLSVLLVLVPNVAYLGYLFYKNSETAISQYERHKREEKRESLRKLARSFDAGTGDAGVTGIGDAHVDPTHTRPPTNLTESLLSLRLSQLAIEQADSLARVQEWRQSVAGAEVEEDEREEEEVDAEEEIMLHDQTQRQRNRTSSRH